MEDKKLTRKVTQDNMVTEKIDIIENKLLGNYDDSGNYSIAPQIVSELISLKKYRKSSYGNSMFCVGTLLGYGEIAFEVSFDKNVDENTNAKAKLFVLEDVDKVNGYIQNTIKTFIAEFTSNVSSFIEDSYVKFNITNEDSDSGDDEGKDKKELSDLELDDSYILAKKAYMLLLDKLENEKLLDAYGKLFTEKLSTLSKLDNEFSKAVLERFNGQYSKIEELFLKDKNYKDLNELLDSCIEYISGTNEIFNIQEKDFDSKISATLETFTDNVNELNEKSEKKALDMLDESDREKLEEMNDSQGLDESSTDTDNGDAQAEIEVPPESIQPVEEGNSYTYILDNPILYDDIEESDSNDATTDQEEKDDVAIMTPQTPQIGEEQITDEPIAEQDESQEMVDASSNVSEEQIQDELKSIEELIQSAATSSEETTDEQGDEEKNDEQEEVVPNYRDESARQIKTGINQIKNLDSLRKETGEVEPIEEENLELEDQESQVDEVVENTSIQQPENEDGVDKQTQSLSNRMNDLRRYLDEKQNRQRQAQAVVEVVEETPVDNQEEVMGEVFESLQELSQKVDEVTSENSSYVQSSEPVITLVPDSELEIPETEPSIVEPYKTSEPFEEENPVTMGDNQQDFGPQADRLKHVKELQERENF